MSDRLYEQSELAKGQFEFASEYRLEEHPLFEYQIDQWECFPPDAQIHEGGHGVVGEVRVKGGDKEDCRAAIKVYNDDANDDAGAFEIYERELAVRKGLDRVPCVPRLLAWGYFVLADGTRRPAILTDYISGFNLSELVALNGGGFNAETTFKLVELIGASLKELHKRWRGKGAHRDLSSRNVILHPDGQNAETYKAFLVDFSVASTPGYRDQGVSLPGAPAFAAPELFGGEYYDKSKGFLKKPYYNELPTVDIWSLGALAYFLRMGKLPFYFYTDTRASYLDPERTPVVFPRRSSDDWEEIAVFKMNNRLKLLEALEASDMAIGTGDKEIDRFIDRCTQPNPQERFQSAAEALESLQANMHSLRFDSDELLLCSLFSDASSSRVEAEVSVVSDSVDETQRHASFEVGGNSHNGNHYRYENEESQTLYTSDNGCHFDYLGGRAYASIYRVSTTRMLKVFNSDLDEDFVFESRENEVRTLAKLDGADGHAPKLYSKGTFIRKRSDSGLPCEFPAFEMDFVAGEMLEDVIKYKVLTKGASLLDGKRALEVMEKVCEAVAACHSPSNGKGCVHRDLAPKNIMVDIREIVIPDGLPCIFVDNAVIMDWGQAPRSDLHSTPAAKGTPLYAAPELLRAEPTEKDGQGETLEFEMPTVDVWSLGAIAYFVRTGEHPSLPSFSHDEKTFRKWADYREQHPINLPYRNDGYDECLNDFIRCCTRNNPRDRFQNAGEAREYLSARKPLSQAKQHVSFKVGGSSHMGPREKNDDAYRIDWDYRFAAVSDGIGGAPDGDIISRVACGGSLESYRAQRDLTAAFKEGNCMATLVSELIDSPDSGATLLLAAWDDVQMRMQFAWVGDSIAYRLRDGRLEQLTRTGRAGQSNALDKAVGYSRELTPDEDWCNIEPGDRFLLCTDGVWETYEERLGRDLLIERLSAKKLPHFIATDIAQEAGRNGYDNATAVVILVEDDSTLPLPQLKH